MPAVRARRQRLVNDSGPAQLRVPSLAVASGMEPLAELARSSRARPSPVRTGSNRPAPSDRGAWTPTRRQARADPAEHRAASGRPSPSRRPTGNRWRTEPPRGRAAGESPQPRPRRTGRSLAHAGDARRIPLASASKAEKEDVGAPAGRAGYRAGVTIREFGDSAERLATRRWDPDVAGFTDRPALTVGRPLRHTSQWLSFETVTAFPSGVGRSFRASASRLL